MLTQTLTLILIPTLALTQTEEKHYFASRGEIATSFFNVFRCLGVSLHFHFTNTTKEAFWFF